MSWMDRANCIGTDLEQFYPKDGGTGKPAKRICAACDVKAECLQWALDTNDIHAVLGGTTVRDRMRLRRMLSGTFTSKDVARHA